MATFFETPGCLYGTFLRESILPLLPRSLWCAPSQLLSGCDNAQCKEARYWASSPEKNKTNEMSRTAVVQLQANSKQLLLVASGRLHKGPAIGKKLIKNRPPFCTVGLVAVRLYGGVAGLGHSRAPKSVISWQIISPHNLWCKENRDW